MDSVKFKLDAFEGPLDLLLHLIRKSKLSIYDIPIALVTEQYLDYLKTMQEMDLEISSEFIVMAAQLLQIKSRMLLPNDSEPDGEEEDPREELAKRLAEYRSFKAVGLYLRQYEGVGASIFCKSPDYIERRVIDNSFKELTLDNLIGALTGIHDKNTNYNTNTKEALEEIVYKPRVSVFKKVKDILKRIRRFTRVRFNELFRGMDSKSEAVAGFLAVLELVKLNRLTLTSEEGEVVLTDNERRKKHGD